MRIVVLAGGLSMERNVSLSSGNKICRALRARGHQAILVDMFMGFEDYDGKLEDVFDAPNGFCGDYSVAEAEPDLAAGAAVEAVGLSVIDWQSRLTAKHIFTHVEWRMTGYALTVRGDGPAELEWVDAAGLAARSVPSAFARYYEEAKRELEMK